LPTYQAQVHDRRTGKRLSRSFETRAEAKRWRQEAMVDIRRGGLALHPTGQSVEAAMTEWLAAAKAGAVRTRGRVPYAPSTLVSLEKSYRLHVRSRFGAARLDSLTLRDIQDWVEDLQRAGMCASTISSSLLPLRMLYRRAKRHGQVTVSPVDGVEVPLQRRRRRKPVDVSEVHALMNALAPADHPLWGLAIYAGLRRGELLGLYWEDVDLDERELRVERSWNPNYGYGPPKSEAGQRVVPVPDRLATILRQHAHRTQRHTGPMFLGRTGVTPPAPGPIQVRADRAWQTTGLPRTTLHACRHLYASVSAAAGVPLHELSRYMGHSSIAMTIDLYTHLFRGSQVAAAAKVNAYYDSHAPEASGHDIAA